MLVQVADLGRLELVTRGTALVDDEQRQHVFAGTVSATLSTCSASGGGMCALRSFGSFTRWSRARFGSTA